MQKARPRKGGGDGPPSPPRRKRRVWPDCLRPSPRLNRTRSAWVRVRRGKRGVEGRRRVSRAAAKTLAACGAMHQPDRGFPQSGAVHRVAGALSPMLQRLIWLNGASRCHGRKLSSPELSNPTNERRTPYPSCHAVLLSIYDSDILPLVHSIHTVQRTQTKQITSHLLRNICRWVNLDWRSTNLILHLDFAFSELECLFQEVLPERKHDH